MTKIGLVVSDFDGTLTDVDKEAAPYTPGFQNSLARKLDLNLDHLVRMWNLGEEEIRKSPSKFGWFVNEIIMASAYADPYQMGNAATTIILDKLGKVTDLTERQDLLGELFKENYELTITCLRDGLDPFMSIVKSLASLCIVTNSSPDKVQSKILTLPSNHSDVPLYGFAKKYVPTPLWERVPEKTRIQGLERDIYVRRGIYGDLLLRLMDEKKLTPEEVLVIGDIYELDLVLPQFMGMKIGLLPRVSTPDFEKQAVIKAGGFVSYTLEDTLEEIRRLTN